MADVPVVRVEGPAIRAPQEAAPDKVLNISNLQITQAGFVGECRTARHLSYPRGRALRPARLARSAFPFSAPITMPHASSSLTLRAGKRRYHRPARYRAFLAPTPQLALRPATGPSGWFNLLAKLLDDLTGIQGLLDCVWWGILLLGQAENLLRCLSKRSAAEATAWAEGCSRQFPRACPRGRPRGCGHRHQPRS